MVWRMVCISVPFLLTNGIFLELVSKAARTEQKGYREHKYSQGCLNIMLSVVLEFMWYLVGTWI